MNNSNKERLVSLDLDQQVLFPNSNSMGTSTMRHEKRQLALIRCFLFGLSFLPFAYVWSLPLLQMVGYANEGDVGPDTGKGIYTVSGYISTAEATGGMAATFFWPILFMWQGPRHKKTDRFTGLSFHTIFVF